MSRRSLGAALTVLAMLAFASMDASTKWLVVDYPAALPITKMSPLWIARTGGEKPDFPVTTRFWAS